MNITFDPVQPQNYSAVAALHIAPAQKGMVETVAECCQEAREFPCWRPTVISVDGVMVGFSMYGLWVSPSEPSRVWLDRFFIDQRFQGHGYAKAILPQLLAHIVGIYACDAIYLSVYATNTPAIRLYEALGFSFNGETDVNGERVMVLRDLPPVQA